MARAKRTDRAEARRRYRASLEPATVATEDDTAEAAATPNRLSGRAASNQSAAAVARPAARTARPGDLLATEPVTRRPGFFGSITGAITPLDLRADLAALPALTTRTRAIWLPSLIVAVSGVSILIPSLQSNTIVGLVASLFVAPPPMAGPFLAGILAPRAGWLAGGIVGLVSAIFFGLYLATAPASVLTNATSEARFSAIVQSFVIAPMFGILVGGFAAFYRRFLRLSSPNPGARGGGKPASKQTGRTAKPAPRRR